MENSISPVHQLFMTRPDFEQIFYCLLFCISKLLGFTSMSIKFNVLRFGFHTKVFIIFNFISNNPPDTTQFDR